MEHDFSINGSFTIAGLQMFFCAGLMCEGILRKYNFLGRFARFTVSCFYSFAPVAMLIYSLYKVYNLR